MTHLEFLTSSFCAPHLGSAMSFGSLYTCSTIILGGDMMCYEGAVHGPVSACELFVTGLQ